MKLNHETQGKVKKNIKESQMLEKIAVIGLGYVGLPLALALAKKFPDIVGFDINFNRIECLKKGIDKTGELSYEELSYSTLTFTTNPNDLSSTNFFIITVPIHAERNSNIDMSSLIEASKLVAGFIKPGAVIVYETTVYPGATEEIFGPILANFSNLRQAYDFKLGYSPERINPGNRNHTLEKIVKVVAAEDLITLERVATVYERIIDAEVYRAPSIKVAEAAKIIENVQRDVNIALMNEFALILDHLNIQTNDVIAAASTKWNFVHFTPGLVGGRCITNAARFLDFKARQVGYTPKLLLSSRYVNDYVAIYLVQRLIHLLGSKINGSEHKVRVGILGLAFKEDVTDIRDSRVFDVINELRRFGVEPFVHDPLVDPEEAKLRYDIELRDISDFSNLDALIFAVPHKIFLKASKHSLLSSLSQGGVLIDVKSVFKPSDISNEITYWSF